MKFQINHDEKQFEKLFSVFFSQTLQQIHFCEIEYNNLSACSSENLNQSQKQFFRNKMKQNEIKNRQHNLKWNLRDFVLLNWFWLVRSMKVNLFSPESGFLQRMQQQLWIFILRVSKYFQFKSFFKLLKKSFPCTSP